MRIGDVMRLIRRLRSRSSDSGFTLVELVVTVAIVGIIVVALTGVVISYLKTTVDAQARLTESQDVQLAAVYWQRDVASIGVRTYDSGTKTFPLSRSVGVTPACALPSGTEVVTLGWSQYSSADSTANPTTITVSYVAQADGVGYNLLRVRCTGSTQDSSIEVAHNLNLIPTSTCNVSCSGAGDDVPTVVSLNLSVLDPDGHGTAASAYTATLKGERRQT